ncbi:DUF305 domain-containing protein [Streptomyces physcomitrii]|uniref:DUF305 domain-containing protein n=1 Tax=Streptomyces physcomitrii TaxID=2724184 RepID=A0ABX1HAK8_9ACTN|nr:DUF305 domain-containing protein [Streptomyces physcomitrii]
MSHRSQARSPRPHRRPSRAAAAAAVLAVVLALAGCESDGEGKARGGSGSPSVIAPGKPGEAAETLDPKEAAERKSDDRPNSADFRYAQMMITHHAQALEMTRLAPKQAGQAKVRRLAARISAAQGPEIEAMEGWLTRHGGPREDAHAHHHDMPGMASEAQLKKLRAAEGEKFDALFLKLMITHHGGALTMATEVQSEGNNIQIEEMATDVVAQQTSEINRMRDMS